MTGNLAVTPRPAIAERTVSAPVVVQRPRAAAVAISSGAEPHFTAALAGSGAEAPSAARLKALLADPSVQVLAHRDDASARLVLQVRDRATGEVIEQYPPEQLLRFYAALRESLGALVDQCA